MVIFQQFTWMVKPKDTLLDPKKILSIEECYLQTFTTTDHRESLFTSTNYNSIHQATSNSTNNTTTPFSISTNVNDDSSTRDNNELNNEENREWRPPIDESSHQCKRQTHRVPNYFHDEICWGPHSSWEGNYVAMIHLETKHYSVHVCQ